MNKQESLAGFPDWVSQTEPTDTGPAFNLAGHDRVGLAEALNMAGVESRAGCHCATLAHRALRLDPPASCRLSFYLYNTLNDVDRAVDG